MSLDNFLSDYLKISDFENRAALLIELAERFTSVPESIVKAPYPEKNKVPGCESDVYIFYKLLDNGNKKFYFAVNNPQGISAKAFAVILDDYCSNVSKSEIEKVPDNLAYLIFGSSLSMGKGQGLSNMLQIVKKLD